MSRRHKHGDEGQINRIEQQEKQELRELDRIEHEVEEIEEQLHGKAAKSFKITQFGGIMPTNNSITPGSIGNFTAVTSPAGSTLQAGSVPVWTSDNALTSLTPSSDGMSVAVATSSSDVAPSFNLTISGVSSNGAPISSSVLVSLVGGTGGGTPATGFSISQVS